MNPPPPNSTNEKAKIYKLALNGEQLRTVKHCLNTMAFAVKATMGESAAAGLPGPIKAQRRRELEAYEGTLNTVISQADMQD